MWDFTNDMSKSLAELDQKLVPFKKFYANLNEDKRLAFVEWVRKVSEPFPLDFDSLICAHTAIGCGGHQWITAQIEVSLGDPEEANTEIAKIPPQILRAAVDAWERNEEFVPPMTFDFT